MTASLLHLRAPEINRARLIAQNNPDMAISISPWNTDLRESSGKNWLPARPERAACKLGTAEQINGVRLELICYPPLPSLGS
jgi:hypothetical protein